MEGNTKYLIVIVAIVVVLGGWYWMSRPEPVVDNRLPMICVESGKVFKIAREDLGPVRPFDNPETGEQTLLPFIEGEDGVRRISSRDRGYLQDLGEKNRYVDAETLVVKSAD